MPRVRKPDPRGKDRGVQLEMPAARTRRLRVAAIRMGLLTLRAQLEDLLGQVERLHQPRRGPSGRP